MKNKRLLGIMAFLIAVSIFFIGCRVAEEEVAETAEEAVDTGALVIESTPSLAQVYIAGDYIGDTPLTLYNLPVGYYDIAVRKEGYADFKITAAIKVGRTEEVDATLTPAIAEEKKPVEQALPETASAPQLNKISLSSFAMYYDFDKVQFSELSTDKSDIFSRKYDTYIHFTALTPAKIYVLNKPLKEAKKEDCIFGDTVVAPLFSGQTLCISTSEGSVVALGFEAKPDELEWMLLS